jgi:multiple sugar transport system permease protein
MTTASTARATAAGVTKPARRRNTLGRQRARLGVALVIPAGLMLAVFFFWPLLRAIFISFFDYPLLGTPTFVGVQNYVQAFTDSDFGRAALFTLIYTVIITPVLLIAGFALALLVRRGTRPARIFQTIYFLPVVIGLASASYLGLYMWQPDLGPVPYLLQQIGIGDSSHNLFASLPSAFTIVLITVSWKVVGLQMLLLLAGMQSVPSEIIEAARVDGASGRKVFRHITLPLLRPTLALVLVFSVAGSLLAFDQFYIMTSGGPENSTITAVYQIFRVSFQQFQVGYGSALSLLLMLVLGAVSVGQLLLLRNSDNS